MHEPEVEVVSFELGERLLESGQWAFVVVVVELGGEEERGAWDARGFDAVADLSFVACSMDESESVR